MTARGFDHLVWAVEDLDAAAAGLEALGFTVTPRARHPWGTENRLVQLDGFFLELLAIGEGADIPEAKGDVFSDPSSGGLSCSHNGKVVVSAAGWGIDAAGNLN